MRKSRKLQTRQVLVGLVVFVTMVVLVVTINSLTHGFDFAWSISRCVGLELWSVILFTLGNVLVTAVMARVLWKIGEAWEMPRPYYYCAFAMCVALIWLSVCPIGFCDVNGERSIVSWLHMLASRTLFVMMAIVAAMILRNKKASALTQGVGAAYFCYAIFCVIGHVMQAGWFLPETLIFESTYIVGFLVLLLFCKSKELER